MQSCMLLRRGGGCGFPSSVRQEAALNPGVPPTPAASRKKWASLRDLGGEPVLQEDSPQPSAPSPQLC